MSLVRDSFGWEELKKFLLRDIKVEKIEDDMMTLVFKLIIKNKENLIKNNNDMPEFFNSFYLLTFLSIYQEIDNAAEVKLEIYEEGLSFLISQLINFLFIDASKRSHPCQKKIADVIEDLSIMNHQEIMATEINELQSSLKIGISQQNFDPKKLFVSLAADERMGGLQCSLVKYMSNNPLDLITQTINNITQPADQDSIDGDFTKCKKLLKKLSLVCNEKLREKMRSEVDGLQHLAISMPYLSNYEVQDGFKKLLIPNNSWEASNMAQASHLLLNDIHILWRLFSLPIFEPLLRSRVEILVSIATSCLHAAIACAAAASFINIPSSVSCTTNKSSSSSKDEGPIVFKEIVQKSIDIFNSLLNCLKNSISTNGYIVKNIYWVGCTMLLSGLQAIADMNEIAGRSADKTNKNADIKNKATIAGRLPTKHGFGRISIILVKEAFKWLNEISRERMMPTYEQDLVIKSFDLYEEHSYSQLIASLIEVVDLPSFAIYLVRLSLHKGIMLIKLSKPLTDTRTSNKDADVGGGAGGGKEGKAEMCEDESRKVGKRKSTSEVGNEFANSYIGLPQDEDDDDDDDDMDDDDDDDDDSSESTAFYFEDVSASQDDDSDSDLKNLKKLFEIENEGQAGVAIGTTNKTKIRRKSSSETHMITPDPKKYLTLATDILIFLTKTFLESNNAKIKEYFNNDTLTVEHMRDLAGIIKDLDEISLHPTLNSYIEIEEFSITLTKFIYALISKNCLSNSLQETLLLALGMDISNIELVKGSAQPALWPLRITPRCLNVLLHVVVARNSSLSPDADSSSSHGYNCIISIWNSFLQSLQISFENPILFNKAGLNIDVNVEHMQLLIVLFYMLPHPLKRNIWIQLNLKIIAISNNLNDKKHVENILPLARLLLLINYFLQNFYEMPRLIADQMMFNIHSVLVGIKDSEISFDRFTYFSKIEDKYISETDSVSNQMKFYNIMEKEKSSQEYQKIDGLALSALFSLGSGYDYDIYYECMVKMLLPLSMPLKQADSNHQEEDVQHSQIITFCCHYYYTKIILEILDILPPSVKMLKQFDQPIEDLSPLQILHLLKLDAKRNNTNFSTWLQECFVKMGLSVKEASKLITVRKEAQSIALAHQALKYLLNRLLKKESSLVVNEINMEMLVCLEAIVTIIYLYHLAYEKSVEGEVLLQISKMIYIISNYYARPYLMRTLSDEQYVSSKKLLILNSKLVSVSSPNIIVLHAFAKALSPHIPFPESLKNTLKTFAPKKLPIENVNVGEIVNFVDEILDSNIPSPSPDSLGPQLVRFLEISSSCLQLLYVNESNNLKSSDLILNDMFEISCDASMAFIFPQVSTIINTILHDRERDKMAIRYLSNALPKIVDIIKETINEKSIDDCLAVKCIQFLESQLDENSSLIAMFLFFYQNIDDLYDLLSLCWSSCYNDDTYNIEFLKFFNKLCTLTTKTWSFEGKTFSDKLNSDLLLRLNRLTNQQLIAWLTPIIYSNNKNTTSKDNIKSLGNFASFIANRSYCNEICSKLLRILLEMLMQLAKEQTECVPAFLHCLIILANSDADNNAHAILFTDITNTASFCLENLAQKSVVEKIKDNISRGKHMDYIMACSSILNYFKEVLSALKMYSNKSLSLLDEADDKNEEESDMDDEYDHHQDFHPLQDETDDESLNEKLCTYTVTQKEFMNQHWYNCHS